MNKCLRIFVQIIFMLKNKYELTLWKSRLHTASETFVHHNKFGSGLIFCIFASVAFILIGKDEEYEKKLRNATISESVFNGLDSREHKHI